MPVQALENIGQDKDFLALTPQQKSAFLLKADPDFAALPKVAQGRIIGRFEQIKGIKDPATSLIAAPAKALTESTVGGTVPPSVPVDPTKGTGMAENLLRHANLGPIRPGDALIRGKQAFERGDYGGGVGSILSAGLQTAGAVEVGGVGTTLGAEGISKYLPHGSEIARSIDPLLNRNYPIAGGVLWRRFMPKDDVVAYDRLYAGFRVHQELPELMTPKKVTGLPRQMLPIELGVHEMAPIARHMGIDLAKDGIEAHPEVIDAAINKVKTQDIAPRRDFLKPFRVDPMRAETAANKTLTAWTQMKGEDLESILGKTTLGALRQATTVESALNAIDGLDREAAAFYEKNPEQRRQDISKHPKIQAILAARSDLNAQIDELSDKMVNPPGLDIATRTLHALYGMRSVVGKPPEEIPGIQAPISSGATGAAAQLRMETNVPTPISPVAKALTAMGRVWGPARASADLAKGKFKAADVNVKNAWRRLGDKKSLIPPVKSINQATLPIEPGPQGGPPVAPAAPPQAPPVNPAVQELTQKLTQAGVPANIVEQVIARNPPPNVPPTAAPVAPAPASTAPAPSPALPIGGPMPKVATPKPTPKVEAKIEPLKVTIGSDEVTLLSPEERQAPNARKIAVARFTDHSSAAFAAARDAAEHGDIPTSVINKITKEHKEAWASVESQIEQEAKPVERKAGRRPTSDTRTPAEVAAETRKVEAAKLKEARDKGEVATVISGDKALSAAERIRARSKKKPGAE